MVLLSGAVGLAQSSGATCDEVVIQQVCQAWSEDQKQLCHKLEHVKCCLQTGASQGECCGAAGAPIKSLPLCKTSLKPSDSVQCRDQIGEKCAACGGEKCASCREEEEVRCCLGQGGSTDLCCQSASAEVRESTVCLPALLQSYGASPCEPAAVEAECLGCVGADCQTCREEAAVKCCVEKGGTTESCCKSRSWEVIRSKPICASTSSLEGEGDPKEVQKCTPNAIEATCKDDENAQQCRDEEYLKCCIDTPVGSTEICCVHASPEVQQSVLCQDNNVILP